MLSAKRRRQLGLRPLGESHAESNFLAWNYSWPDLPQEPMNEHDGLDIMPQDEEVYDDFATRALVKTMRRKAAYRAHEPRKCCFFTKRIVWRVDV